ncbi:hypothetical protein GF325_09940 [Candidatus Bathyarchaeota archaeon]|nr:hypothetical protein [Candidatus Bathyarchaeota archaeon]
MSLGSFMTPDMRCKICGATSSSGGFETCCVCNSTICDQCAVKCDGCKNLYCINKCGTDFLDEESYHHCFNCK